MIQFCLYVHTFSYSFLSWFITGREPFKMHFWVKMSLQCVIHDARASGALDYLLSSKQNSHHEEEWKFLRIWSVLKQKTSNMWEGKNQSSFPGGTSGKEPPAHAGDKRGVWSLGGEDPLEEGSTIHSSVLTWRIPVDGGAWWATVHGVAKSQAQLSDLKQAKKPEARRVGPG